MYQKKVVGGTLLSWSQELKAGIPLCSCGIQLLPYLLTLQQFPPEASPTRCSIDSHRGEGAGGPWGWGEGRINIEKRGGSTDSSTQVPLSPIHLWTSTKVTFFTPLLKESLLYNFGKHTDFTRVAEIQEAGREHSYFSKVYLCLKFWTSLTTGFQNNLPLLTP